MCSRLFFFLRVPGYPLFELCHNGNQGENRHFRKSKGSGIRTPPPPPHPYHTTRMPWIEQPSFKAKQKLGTEKKRKKKKKKKKKNGNPLCQDAPHTGDCRTKRTEKTSRKNAPGVFKIQPGRSSLATTSCHFPVSSLTRPRCCLTSICLLAPWKKKESMSSSEIDTLEKPTGKRKTNHISYFRKWKLKVQLGW